MIGGLNPGGGGIVIKFVLERRFSLDVFCAKEIMGWETEAELAVPSTTGNALIKCLSL